MTAADTTTPSNAAPRRRGSRLRRYVGGWVAAAATVTALAGVADIWWLAAPRPPLWLLVVLATIMLAASVGVARLHLAAGVDEQMTALELAAVPVMALLTPAWAAAVALVTLPVAEGLRTRGEPKKVLYNVAVKCVGLTLGSTVHLLLAGPGFVASGVDVLAAMAGGLVFVLVDGMAFVGLLAAASDRRLLEVAAEQWSGMAWVDAGVAATGLLLLVVAVTAPVALPLLAIPVALDRLRARERQDRHELEAAASAAEAASQAKSQFLSHMSHELRTPLNAILGFGQLLDRDQDLPEDARRYVAPILRSGHHLLRLIDEILDLSRIESGRIELDVDDVEATRLVDECLDLVRPLAAERRITLDTHLDDRLVVRADRHRLTQVLMNLLSNGIKYNREGGTVSVCGERRGHTVAIAVRDTGQGIDNADQQRLFVPFERLHPTDGQAKGTGLGLSISRQLVETMGGQLTVDSEPGVGSTFTVVLPATTSDTTAAGDRALPARGARVLHVDGDPASIVLVERALLTRPAVEIASVDDVPAALAEVRDDAVALVLLDVATTGDNAEQALRLLRDTTPHRSLPIVVLGIPASGRQADRLHAAGAAACLPKPLDVAALLALVASHVAPAAGGSAEGAIRPEGAGRH